MGRDTHLPFQERPVSTDALHLAHERRLTSASRVVVPIVEFDGKLVDAGRVGPVYAAVAVYQRVKAREFSAIEDLI